MTRAGSLMIVGHCTIDDIHHADGRELPATMGGGAAYASLGATIAGANVTLVTVVGDDYPIDKLAEGLLAAGALDATHVRKLPGRSVHNDAWYGSDGSRRFEIESWERMETLTPSPDDIPDEAGADQLVLLTPGSLWQQRALVDALKSRGCRVALDTELHYLDSENLRSELLELVRVVDYFLPSIEHLGLLFGARPGGPAAYLVELCALGCPVVAVKQGAAGSTVIDLANAELWRAPALDGLQLEDTTGAGDGFGGGLLAAIAGGSDLADAVCWGTVAASFVIEAIGARVPDHFSSARASERFDSLRPRIARHSVSVLSR